MRVTHCFRSTTAISKFRKVLVREWAYEREARHTRKATRIALGKSCDTVSGNPRPLFLDKEHVNCHLAPSRDSDLDRATRHRSCEVGCDGDR
jgi:hypothetical protein